MKLGRLVAAAVALAVLWAVPASAADSFYDNLEEQGIRAAARGDHERAAKLLRLAAFGLLEEPPRLAACLARLLPEQAKIGDDDGFRLTFRRLLEVEQRFQGFSQAKLPGDVLSQPEVRFFRAVVLFEAGEVKEAADLLEGCLPLVPANDFTRGYAEKIRAAVKK